MVFRKCRCESDHSGSRELPLKIGPKLQSPNRLPGALVSPLHSAGSSALWRSGC